MIITKATSCVDCRRAIIPETESARWCCRVWRCFSCWAKHIDKEM